MIETAAVTQFSLPHMSTRPGADQSTLFAPSLRRGKVSLSSSTEARRAAWLSSICWISTFFARF